MIVSIGLILLALIGAPLFTLFGAASIMLFLGMPEGSWASVAIDVFSAKFAENPTLMTIPLFTFAGYLLAEAKTPQRLVDLSQAWFGWMPGGLAVVALVACAFFTTFTGGSGITIVAVGGLLLPALLQERYPHKFSLGLVTVGGSLGILFPPSVPLIMYGIIAGLVMDKVLVAGLVPGTLVVVALAIYSAIVGIRSKVQRHRFDLKRAVRALWVAKWEALIPIVLIGGMATGVLRIHEASAFTAVYVLFIEVFVYRDIKIGKNLAGIIIESMTLVGAILTIMAAAVGFNSWMIQAEIPMALLDYFEQIISSKVVFLLVLNVFLLIVGMLMDIFTAIVVVVPLILPMAYAYGVDPYHLAIIFLLNLEIGYLTPPVGVNLFISSIRFGQSITYLYRLVMPFIGILIVTLGVVSYVPVLTTWLPGKLKVEDEVKTLGGGYLADDAFGDEAKADDMGGGIDLAAEDLLAPEDGGVDAGPTVDEAKPDEAKPGEAKPEETKADEAKSGDAKPEEAKADEAKPEAEAPKAK